MSNYKLTPRIKQIVEQVKGYNIIYDELNKTSHYYFYFKNGYTSIISVEGKYDFYPTELLITRLERDRYYNKDLYKKVIKGV